MRPLRAAPDPVVIRAFWCYYLCIRRLWRAKFDIDQRQHADPSAQSAPGTNGQDPLQRGCSEGSHGIATQHWNSQLMGVQMGTETILAFLGGYIATAIAVILLYSPVLVLFAVLLLTAGILRLIALICIVMIRRLRRRGKPNSPSDGTWLLH